MECRKQLSLELEPSYFQLQAYWGATKHMGGLKATKALIKLCHINKNRIRQVGTKDFSRAMCTFLSLYISNPAFRKYARKTLPPIIIKNIFEYLGYGIYVGRK